MHVQTGLEMGGVRSDGVEGVNFKGGWRSNSNVEDFHLLPVKYPLNSIISYHTYIKCFCGLKI